MKYRATKAETEILTFLKKQSDKSANKSNFNEAALEGCLVKGFVLEKDGVFFLTKLGEKQI